MLKLPPTKGEKIEMKLYAKKLQNERKREREYVCVSKEERLDFKVYC